MTRYAPEFDAHKRFLTDALVPRLRDLL